MIFSYFFISLLISIQVCTYSNDVSVEFIRLEELKEAGVREVFGEGNGWSEEEEEEEEEDTEEEE